MYKCKICKEKISYKTALYGSKMCKSCSAKKRKRQPHSEETKLKMSKAKVGIKRKPFTKEHRENISKSKLDVKFTKQHKLNMSIALKGKKKNPFTEEHRRNISKSAIGKKLSEQHKENISKGKQIPGLDRDYPLEFRYLREEIRKRDNYTCQYCGMTQEQHFNQYNKNIEVHHIDYNKYNLNLNNLITLCKKCNNIGNFNRDYWFAYYTYLINLIKK